MPTKTKKVIPNMQVKKRVRKEKVMPAEEIKKWSEVLKRIATRKSKGFIFIGEVKDVKDATETNGTAFTCECPRRAIMNFMKEAIDISPLDLLMSEMLK